MKIYIAGSSNEIELVEKLILDVKSAGHTITEDWCAVIRRVGHANPADATHEMRTRWCLDDLAGVRDAALVWLVLPWATVNSFGATFEFGVAYQLGRKTIVSGDWRRTIFTSLATHRFDTHNEALEWLLEQP